MEGYDRTYFSNLCSWISQQQKEIDQPTVYWVDDISLKHGPVKLLEHVRLYIDSVSAADIEISSDYTQVRIYPQMTRRALKTAKND
jgi:hypothetical protein